MNFLSLFVLIPLLMMAGLALSKEMKQIRAVAVIGSSLQLVFAFIVLFMFLGERAAGNTAEMLFVADTVWYAPLQIHYTVGVCGYVVVVGHCGFCRGFRFMENRSAAQRILPLVDTSLDRGIRFLYFDQPLYDVHVL